MSSSVKLQIVRALDSSTRLKDGMDWFLGNHHLQKDQAPDKSPYQKMLNGMLLKQVGLHCEQALHSHYNTFYMSGHPTILRTSDRIPTRG